MPVIDLQSAANEIEQCSDKNVPSEINSNSPLYVLYTSGSTGQPKGVVGRHKGTINRFSWMWNKYPFTSGEVCVQKTTLNFVDSIWEIFGPLLKGITLVIAPDEIVADPEVFIPFLADHSVTRIVLVPSILQAMLDHEPNLGKRLPKLQMWTTSGEALSVKLYNELLTAHPYVRLLNIYGSSEVAADVTCLDTSQYPTPDQMYIGKPIDNIKVYILDELMEPVPIGVPGELYFSGPGVALGYHNQPELTKERFLDNPFEPDSIVFKTGDVARFNSDGQIEYMGRSDFQLKIRGVRMEPAEVELALADHVAIQEAIVGAWENELVAWFKLADDVKVSPEISDLRLFLSKTLPTYMIPTRFVNLPKVPRTPNGKLDRNQLPEPTLDIYRTELPYTPPSDDVEEKLAAIWKQVLSVQKVSIFDDFFDLGGQSIMAVQMFGRIRDEFGANMSLSQLFVSSTIASLADVIRSQDLPDLDKGISASTDIPTELSHGTLSDFEYLVEINQGASSKIPFYCVHGAGGNVLFFQKWKKHLKDYSFCAFQARGIDGITAPHESIVEMAADYLKELLRVNPNGPWILGGYSGGGVVALEMAIQLQSMGFELPPVIMLDTFHPHVQPRNYTMKDRVHLLATNPVDYVKNVAQKRVASSFKKEYTREELDEMMANGTPLPIELRDDFMTDQFAKLLEQYPKLVPFEGEVLLLCAKEIWHMFAHAGFERGWKDVLTNLTVREVPGDHFTIIEEPAVLELLNQLKIGISKLSGQTVG